MKRPAGKKSFRFVVSLISLTLLLGGSIFQFELPVSAQRKGQRQTKPQPQPKATPAPQSSLETMGAPPPVPSLKKQPEQEVSPGDIVSVDTTEVMFPVTVRDSNGRLVNELTRTDFRVFEDGAMQPLSDL